jgi:Ca-activated chloride channel family protein
MLSDGRRTIGQDPIPVAREAARLKIPIFTVSLGTDEGRVTVPGGAELSVPPDPVTLRRVARISGGRAYEVADADELESILRAARVAHRDQARAARDHGRVRRRRAPAAGGRGGERLRFAGRLP